LNGFRNEIVEEKGGIKELGLVKKSMQSVAKQGFTPKF
jgi:hypothetical protein